MSAQPAVVSSSAATGARLFVSTCLDTWLANNPELFARDVQINDTAYRRLDPEYYAWLRSRMNLVKHAAATGRITPDAFEELRQKFNAVHEWAIEHFGEAVLLDAIRNHDTRNYAPPVAEDDRPVRAVRAAKTFAAEAVAVVDQIRDQALALGWTVDRLYGTGGSSHALFGKACGLAGLLNPTHRIGEVTRQSIEIILPNGARQRFYNPEVEQPWIRRVKSE